MGLKGGISIDADSGPLRYVLWWYLSPARHFYSDWLWPYCGNDLVQLNLADNLMNKLLKNPDPFIWFDSNFKYGCELKFHCANISLRSTDRPKRSPNHLCTYNVRKGQSKLNKKKKNYVQRLNHGGGTQKINNQLQPNFGWLC